MQTLSRQLFTRVTGSILVSVSPRFHSTDDTNKINIGLNLKFSKRNEEIPGYTKREGNLWLYSEKVIELVKAYNEFCPKLFEFLNSRNENVYYLEDIFPERNGKEKLTELSAWIKAQPYYSIERRSCGTQMIDPEVVKKIEEIVSDVKSKNKPKEVVMKVKPHLLYKADLYLGNVMPDPNSNFQLYDRVINVRESYTVPLGSRGTIIAMHKSETNNQDSGVFDVVFDEEFPGGLSLNCSSNKGYRLPKSALINKSYGQRDYELKTGKKGELIEQMKTSAWHNAEVPLQRSYGQQHSAFVPCPPGKSGQPLYIQPNQFMYKNAYNMYSHSQPLQPRIPQPIQVMGQHSRNFLPAFANNEKSKNNTGQLPKFQHNSGNKQSRSVEKDAESSQAPRIDTDFLKRVLKITPDNTPSNKVEVQKQVKVEDIFMHAKNKPLVPIQPKQEDMVRNSAKLLSYYQKSGLGCPHYSYFDLPDKTVQAQLLNPFNKQVICGKPSVDKAEACENTAGEVLRMIENLSLQQPAMPCIPQPPKTWCQQQSKNTTPDRKTNSSNSKTYVNSAMTSPFIPLQAVKHKNRNIHINKSDSARQNAMGASTYRDDNTYTMNQLSKGPPPSASETQKPYRKRTMRIAAKFPTTFNYK